MLALTPDQVELLCQPGSTVARIHLQPGQQIAGRAGSLMAVSSSIQVTGGLPGGAMGTLKRLLTGGTASISLYTCGERPGEVILAPQQGGDIVIVELKEDSQAVQSGSILAVTPGLKFSTLFPGLKGMVANRRQVMCRVEGSGLLLLSCAGLPYRLAIPEGERYLVDVAQVLTFPTTVTSSYVAPSADGLLRSAMAGHAMVLEVIGPGEIVMQTRGSHPEASTLASLTQRT